MTEGEIADRVKALIVDVTGVKLSEIEDDQTLLDEDLRLDSLDAAELVIAAESEFNIEVEDGAMSSAKTVGDVIRIVSEAL